MEHEKFQRFVPSIENSVARLDTYTYDSKAKKVSCKIVKRVQIEENIEEQGLEQQLLVEDSSTDLLATTTTNRALAKSTEHIMASITHQVKEWSIEIARLKGKLEHSKKLTNILVLHIVSFNNFIGYAQEVEKVLHAARQEFYAKVVEFLDLYVKLQTLVQQSKDKYFKKFTKMHYLKFLRWLWEVKITIFDPVITT